MVPTRACRPARASCHRAPARSAGGIRRASQSPPRPRRPWNRAGRAWVSGPPACAMDATRVGLGQGEARDAAVEPRFRRTDASRRALDHRRSGHDASESDSRRSAAPPALLPGHGREVVSRCSPRAPARGAWCLQPRKRGSDGAERTLAGAGGRHAAVLGAVARQAEVVVADRRLAAATRSATSAPAPQDMVHPRCRGRC